MFIIYYNKKIYHIEKKKLISVLEHLSNEKINEKNVKKYLKHYHLYYDTFLKNINLL